MSELTVIKVPRWRLWLETLLDNPVIYAADRVFTGVVLWLIVFVPLFFALYMIFAAFGYTKDEMAAYRFVLIGVPSVLATLAAVVSLKKGIRGASVIFEIVMTIAELF